MPSLPEPGPLRTLAPVSARVLSRTGLTPEIYSLWLKPSRPAPEPEPGQFYGIKIPGRPELLLRRPVSVADYRKGRLRFVIRIAGQGTAELSRVSTGTELDILGPLGSPAPLVDGRNVLLCGGGVGSAPLLLLARRLAPKNRLTVLIGARRSKDLILVGEFRKLGARVLIATEDGSRGMRGLVTELAARVLPKISAPVIYCCGPRAMLKRLNEIAGRLPVWGFLEERMGCGTGICYCCGVARSDGGYLRICREGPVVNLKEVQL